MNQSSASPASNSALPQAKPIRFVTNNDGPYAKRRRINSACLTCRRRKTRCSGERPVCGTCAQNKHECGGYGAEGEQVGLLSPVESGAGENKDGIKRAVLNENSAPGTRSPTSSKRAQQYPRSSTARPVPQHTFSAESTASLRSEPSATHHVNEAMAGERKEENEGSSSEPPPLSLSTRNRMPYFRYFGPTAIMPGFKQMVVKVREKQHSAGATSTDPLESPSAHGASAGHVTPSQHGQEARTPLEIPIYDTSAMAPSPLITHLCKIFFIHLGCNFPFLQQERFMRDLEEKQVDAILVDAVCALAARFSNHPMLTGQSEGNHEAEKAADKAAYPPSEYGQAFAQRAKSAITDTFACPSVAVVQAALLLAYDEFGANRDSGLWMYLGIAIRMAQDLGMQTLEGLKFEGRNGPTPKSIKASQSGYKSDNQAFTASNDSPTTFQDEQAIQEQKAVERERLDTFWAVFFLDRVISSGTGRPVTLRDRDIEISFPSLDEVDPSTGWPVPFPALIRIIHLYGRVTDLLNRIKEVSHVTPDTIKRLASMETQLTDIYQGLSPRLHFNAVNFQHYVKAGQGTNFILLHFWFHTLIVLLHQPTLLKTFEGEIEQLLPNSRELSMSSAKTIADILAFAELIDAKSSVGNPFTSQPIYIAACAFLKEAALHSASSNPQSRPSTPPGPRGNPEESESAADSTMKNADWKRKHNTAFNGETSATQADQKQAAKHTLLATAANQNYQRCYRALQSLETYWAGVKYILTVLDQKAKGVVDPLLYTREEMESALELPRPEPAFTSPGWRRKLSWGAYLTPQNVGDMAPAQVTSALRQKAGGNAASPIPEAIGWSLTGTMNSPSTSLAVLYPTDIREQKSNTRHHPSGASQAPVNPSIASVMARSSNLNNASQPGCSANIKFEPPSTPAMASSSLPHISAAGPISNQSYNSRLNIGSMRPPPTFHTSVPGPSPPITDPSLVSDADLLLNLHTPSPFTNPSPQSMRLQPQQQQYAPSTPQGFSPSHQNMPYATFTEDGVGGQLDFNNMMIESQDIDMSALGDDITWLEYLPLDAQFWDQGLGGGDDAVSGAQH